MCVVEPGTELAFLWPLPVRRLWGVGPATHDKLARRGIATIGDLAAAPERMLVDLLGDAQGRHLHLLANNRDDRAVESDRATKSVGHEETFARDRTDRGGLEQDVVRMADLVGVRLRTHHLVARTVQLKLRFADFTTITRARTLPAPTDLGAVLAASALELLAVEDLRDGIRLLGVTALQIAAPSVVQGQLSFGDGAVADDDEAVDPERADSLERTLDAVRARFGPDAVGRAAFAAGGRVRTDRRGSLFGPDDDPPDGE
jgi:DNA polymerase-4